MYTTNNGADPYNRRASASITLAPAVPPRGSTAVAAVRQTPQAPPQVNAHTMTPNWDGGETLENQREDRIVYGSGGGADDDLADGRSPGEIPNLTPEEEDLVHEVLAMNTYAMQRCAAEELEPAITILEDALARLQPNTEEDPQATVLRDAQLLDQLQSTTLNNMGVVESHRGRARQALTYFEGARQLEDAWGLASPSLALNTCAAYNTLGLYEKATAAALETIDMLRALEVQRQRDARMAQRRRARDTMTAREAALAARADEADSLEAASEVRVASSDNKALWGAAWHNLGVAQVNTARKAVKANNTSVKKDQSEYTNALKILQNAMQATQDLLGSDHPMYKAVVETYRAVRQTLRDGGAFKQHRTLMTAPLPPVDPRVRDLELQAAQPGPSSTRHRAIEKKQKDLTITFRGQVTENQKLIERTDPEPYPNASRSRFHRRGHPLAGSTNRKQRQLRGTLQDANDLYGSHSQNRALLSRSAPPGGGGDRDGMLPPLLTDHMSGSRPHASRTPPPLALTFDGSTQTAGTGTGTAPVQQQQPRPRQSSTMGTQTQAVEPAPPAPAAAPVFTDSARFLLLASAPPAAAAGEEDEEEEEEAQEEVQATPPARKQTCDGGVQTDDTLAQAAAAPFATSPHSSMAGSHAAEPTPSPARAAPETPTQRHSVASQSPQLEDASTNTPLASASHSQSPSQQRHLFDAMWVTADERYINQGKRNFDVPAYYVPDVEDRAKESLRRASGSATRGDAPAGGVTGDGEEQPFSSKLEQESAEEEEEGSALFIAPNKELHEL